MTTLVKLALLVNMHVNTASFLFVLLPTITLSAPTAAGSKHNVYLISCEPEDCSDWYCDFDYDGIRAAAFFRDGPISEGSQTRIQRPTSLATLSSPRTKWEGSKRTVRLGRDGTFTSNIDAGANSAVKGLIAGNGTLGTEPFVCFKDGATDFLVVYDDERYTCLTDYWCPSIDVGSGGVVMA